MAKILCEPRVDMVLTISLTESEARALDALVGYGDDAFIEAFYERLGKAYMIEHEQGLRSLFKSWRGFMPAILSRVDRARKAFSE